MSRAHVPPRPGSSGIIRARADSAGPDGYLGPVARLSPGTKLVVLGLASGASAAVTLIDW